MYFNYFKINPSDDEYYSEDFEQEEVDEVVEVIQEINVPKPKARPQLQEAHESPSEDAIIVFKSATGPRLTIQPKKAKKHESPRVQMRTISESSIMKTTSGRNSYLKKSHHTTSFAQKRLPPPGKPRINETNAMVACEKSEESIHHEGIIDTRSNLHHESPRGTRQLVKASYSTSSNNRMGLGPRQNSRNAVEPYNYRVTTTTICTGPVSGNRKVPGSTNITNRNYTREKRYIATPYGNYHTPARIEPSKKIGVVAQRVASAKRVTSNDLKNRISVLIKEIEV